MQGLAVNGYTAEQVIAELHRAGRTVDFRFELLDASNVFKAEIVGMEQAEVSNNALADIKRTARFSLRDGLDSVNWLSDRIKPYFRLRMPDGGWAEWPQGVFLLSTPSRRAEDDGSVIRDVEAYDQLVILRDDRVADRYTIAAAVNYISGTNGVKALLDSAGIAMQNLTPTTKTTPVAVDWPPGTSKLKIVNDLLLAINYRSLSFDEVGRAVAKPYIVPTASPVEYVYQDDGLSVLSPEATETLDLFDVANKWVLVVSEPDRTPISSTYTNANASSPTSTVSRGRTIVDFRESVDAVDQATLDALAQRLAFEASQVYASVEFRTATMPMHGDSDVIEVYFEPLGVGAKYVEHTWSLPLEVGGQMRHDVRRVVSV